MLDFEKRNNELGYRVENLSMGTYIDMIASGQSYMHKHYAFLVVTGNDDVGKVILVPTPELMQAPKPFWLVGGLIIGILIGIATHLIS